MLTSPKPARIVRIFYARRNAMGLYDRGRQGVPRRGDKKFQPTRWIRTLLDYLLDFDLLFSTAKIEKEANPGIIDDEILTCRAGKD